MKKTFTGLQLEEVRQQAEDIISKIDEGMPLRDILANIYVSYFADKSMMQGYIMAFTVLDSIRNFENDYSNMKINPNGYIDARLKELAGGRSLHERCEMWLKMEKIIRMSADIIEKDVNGEVDIRKEAENIDNITVSPAEATEEYEAVLFKSVKESIKDSGILVGTMLENIADVRTADADGTVKLLVDMGIKEIDLRAVMSMLVYAKIKNSQIRNVPVDMTLEQVTTLVCVETEAVKITQALDEGSMPEKVAAGLLAVLGMIVIVCVLFALAMVGLDILIALVAESWWVLLLAIPAIWALCANYYEIVERAFESWIDASEKIAKTVSVAFETIKKGIIRVKRYFTENKLQFTQETEAVTAEELVTV